MSPGAIRYDDPKLQEVLASAYVAGALQGPARRRFETLMPVQPLLPGDGAGNDLSPDALWRGSPGAVFAL